MQSLGAVDPEGIISTLWTIMLVQPLADLLFSGDLLEVVLLGRWRGVSSIWPEWPDRRWLTINAKQDYTPEPVAARVGNFRDLAQSLRRWSVPLCMDADPESGPTENEQNLEHHIRFLDSLVEELEPLHLTMPPKAKTRRRYSGRILIAVVLAARLVKNITNIPELLSDKLANVLPAALRSLVAGVFANDAVEIPCWSHWFSCTLFVLKLGMCIPGPG